MRIGCMTVKKERSECLIAENRILRGHLPMRLRLADPERVTLAEIAKRLGRKALKDAEQVAKPDTILAWYRHLIAQQFDGSRHLAQCRQGKGFSLLATAAPF